MAMVRTIYKAGTMAMVRACGWRLGVGRAIIRG